MPSPLLRGAFYIVCSEALIATMTVAIRFVSQELSNEVAVFFRTLFGLIAVLPFMWRAGPGEWRATSPGLHLLRAGAGMGAMYCFFYSVAHLPLAEATVLALTSPFMIPVLAWLWLGERAPRAALIGAAVGFAGVVCILRPGVVGVSGAALVGLLGAAFSALARVSIRRMGRSESAVRIVFWFGVLGTPVAALPLIGHWQTPSPQALAALVLIGVFATLAQLLFTRAYHLAPAAQIGPFAYVSIVFATINGWLLWGEVPGVATALGMALIAAAGILCLAGNRRPPLPAPAGTPV